MTRADPPSDNGKRDEDGAFDKDLDRLERRLRYIDATAKQDRPPGSDPPPGADRNRRPGNRRLYLDLFLTAAILLILIVWPIIGTLRAFFP